LSEGGGGDRRDSLYLLHPGGNEGNRVAEKGGGRSIVLPNSIGPVSGGEGGGKRIPDLCIVGEENFGGDAVI